MNTLKLGAPLSMDFIPSQNWLATMKSLTELPSYFPVQKAKKAINKSYLHISEPQVITCSEEK